MRKPNAARSATHQTATASTPQGELQRHLQDLGLPDAEAYRRWCREHGFGGALHKGWQERRDEVRHARQLREQAAAAAELLAHAQSLGLPGLPEYEEWCRQHGFATTPRKTPLQRRQELRAARDQNARAAIAGTRRHQRRPEEVLCALHAGESPPEALRTPYLQRAAALFARPGDAPETRGGLLRLLLHLHGRARLFGAEPVTPAFGAAPGNTFLDGIQALAGRCGDWLRAPEDWRPSSHNAHRQFGSLARHLLARYPVPDFMDGVWFLGEDAEAGQQQGWFVHVGMGRNIRTADIPMHLTKMMAHHFLQAPAEFTVVQAFRWGQILGLGGDSRLARAVAATRLRRILPDEPFWQSVLHFFVNNPMLDTACIGPIVDYIHHQRFEPANRVCGCVGACVCVAPDGQRQQGGPPCPGFSMKGRTGAALWRLVEAWHLELARESRRVGLTWEPSGIGSYRHVGKDDSGRRVVWAVQELLSHRDLVEEGRAMHHCVASYARSCSSGRTSIWSVTVEDAGAGLPRRAMTVEVDNARRAIVQARGRCNKLAGSKHASERLNAAPHIVRLWAGQERLGITAHLSV